MKPGDAFDPVDVIRQKIYPVDAVDAMIDLNDGPKRVYSKLFQIAVTADRRKYPWAGYVYTSEQYLSELLGKSESGIRRDAAVLRDVPLIRIERPNRQRSNHYSFLWHACFDSANVRGQEPDADQSESANVRRQEFSESANVRGQEFSESANVRGRESANMRGRIKEEPLIEPLKECVRENDVEERFWEFQSAYPEPKREIKVDAACQAYISIVDGKPGEHERVMAGLARWKASADWQRSLSRNNGRFVPFMVTFIGERRYNDHPPPETNTGQPRCPVD